MCVLSKRAIYGRKSERENMLELSNKYTSIINEKMRGADVVTKMNLYSTSVIRLCIT